MSTALATQQNGAIAQSEEFQSEALSILDDRPISMATRAEVDIQISTAKRYPRAVSLALTEASTLATLDEETAASCMYALPRDGKTIEGPSVRLAELIASAWGNLRSEAKVISADDKEITAEATVWDLEKNIAVRIQVKRRITNKYGKRFSDDMVIVTGNAATSIALRNAIFRVIPKAYVDAVYRKARQVAIGDASTLTAKRTAAIEHLGKMGVTPDKVFARLGRRAIEDVTLDDLALLRGLITAIKDNATSVDEAFPGEAEKSAAGVGAMKERLAQQKAAEAPVPPAEAASAPAPEQEPAEPAATVNSEKAPTPPAEAAAPEATETTVAATEGTVPATEATAAPVNEEAKPRSKAEKLESQRLDFIESIKEYEQASEGNAENLARILDGHELETMSHGQVKDVFIAISK